MAEVLLTTTDMVVVSIPISTGGTAFVVVPRSAHIKPTDTLTISAKIGGDLVSKPK